MVHMLASDDWCLRVALMSATFVAFVFELHTLLLETSFHGVGVAVVVLAVLNSDHIVGVSFRQNLAVLNWLDGGVVVVLVHLTVDGSLSLLVFVLLDSLADDGGGNFLVHGGIMVTSLAPNN